MLYASTFRYYFTMAKLKFESYNWLSYKSSMTVRIAQIEHIYKRCGSVACLIADVPFTWYRIPFTWYLIPYTVYMKILSLSHVLVHSCSHRSTSTLLFKLQKIQYHWTYGFFSINHHSLFTTCLIFYHHSRPTIVNWFPFFHYPKSATK